MPAKKKTTKTEERRSVLKGNPILERTVVPLTELKPHPKNYRKHPEDQLRHIRESIARNGVYRNIVVARGGVILAGHGVFEALGQMGVKEAPVVSLDVDPDSPAALKVLTGDNELGHLGEIDDRRLSEILKTVMETDVTGLLGTGYDEMMLANLAFVTRPDGELKNFDAAAAWVGMPGYESGTDMVKLIISFPSEAERKRFTEEKCIRVDKTAVKGTTWSTRWPWTDREDVSAIKFTTKDSEKKQSDSTDADHVVRTGPKIPKRIFRIWLGPNSIPDQFEEWWAEFATINQGWKFVTYRDKDIEALLPAELQPLYERATSYSSRADIGRALVLCKHGGIYVDTDVKPLKPFDPLLEDRRPFAGLRSKKSFEAAVLGSPPKHSAAEALITGFPAWFEAHGPGITSAHTGPQYISHVWFGRPDVRHLPTKTFYPYNGFMAPKRHEKEAMFKKADFPPEMLAAHFSNMRWGGKPK